VSINGWNRLACVTGAAELQRPIVLRPLPGVPVARALLASRML
jgi:succinate dehydrogenase / fumarate reductase iron-sulfur subunit